MPIEAATLWGLLLPLAAPKDLEHLILRHRLYLGDRHLPFARLLLAPRLDRQRLAPALRFCLIMLDSTSGAIRDPSRSTQK